MDTNNHAYSSVAGVLFDKLQTALIQFPAGKAGSQYTIPNNVTNIGDNAFWNCTGLTSVTIPNSVISIGSFAFYYCTSLTSITIPNGVTSIGERVFYACTSLTTVTIPNSVTSIDYGAFAECTGLTNVAVGNSVTNIGDGTFHLCTNLSAITVDTNNPAYSSVAGVLFNKNQTALIQFPAGKAESQYTILNSVTHIWDLAFWNCSSLTSVTIPSSVTSIGEATFWNCTSLTNVTIPNSLTNISSFAFDSCTSLSSVTIPSSVTSIGNWAFVRCASLTGAYFKGNVPSLGGSSVFDGSLNATVYYLPGTTGWDSTYGGRPTALWRPQVHPSDASFGVRTNQFGFTISWASGRVVVVEASTDLVNPIWTPVGTNSLTGGWSYFSDPQWTNYPARFYRLLSP